MKKIFLILSLCFAVVVNSSAQNFLDKAEIEFEVKTNIKKTMGNSSWAEMLKDQMPTFRTGYYRFTFANNKSIYKWHHWDEKEKMPEWFRKADEDNSWYYDHSSGKFNMQKNIWGSLFNVEDSIRNIQWKLENENRVIAGFNCRKATGIIMDSVYVFAFFTEEIMIPGGPCNISGLPGMIMGLTIPRLYTSFIATKVSVNGINEATIKPAANKKNYTYNTLKSTLDERAKDNFGGSDEAETQRWKNQFIWGALL